MIKIEVCANSIQSAIEAEKAGAFRVELCRNLAVGGLTPSIDEIIATKQSIGIELNILIRPRKGNFNYNEREFRIMKEDIHQCGIHNCNGVVFGILNEDHSIDMDRNKELIEIAKKHNMKTTFHRAFDESDDIEISLGKIINIGFDRILTSGGKSTAMEGRDMIKMLIQKAEGKIVIMPGAGVTENNILELASFTQALEIHGSFSDKSGKRKHQTIRWKVEKALSHFK